MNKKKRRKRPWAVFLAIILGIFFGYFAGQDASVFGTTFYSAIDLIGTIFLNALTLVVVPLVSSSIITGISRVGSEGNFGRLGAKMVFFYLATSLMAILIGLFFVNIIHPGNEQMIANHLEEQLTLKGNLATHPPYSFAQVLISIVPSNILAAFSKSEMLGLIFFSVLFGYALSKIDQATGATVQNFFKGIFEAMIQFTHLIMKFLPFGVFCLVAKASMMSGSQSIKGISLFFCAVLLGLLVFVFIGLPLMLKCIAKVSPVRHFKAMAPALVTAFSTSSSSASLPVTMDCVEKRVGVSNRICSLIIPLGTSINMSGSALYECVAAMFVAQAYGIDLNFSTQFFIVVMSLIASIGVAGVPSGSLVAIILILKSVGLPVEGIGLFIAVDRLLDMCRTTANVFSDSCCAVLVAKSEGENKLLTKKLLEDC